jgi:hypothetical protein
LIFSAGSVSLSGLVEIGAVEIHPWGARVEDIEHPDTLVFDLDPGAGIEWAFVVQTALRLRDLLAAEGLDCRPKTTGGKGLHVMVPIEPEMDWDRAHAYTRGWLSDWQGQHRIDTSPPRRSKLGQVASLSTTCAMDAGPRLLAPTRRERVRASHSGAIDFDLVRD